MSLENVAIVFLVGIACGIINTLAGSGSLISLPVLMFIGLDPNVANGTNRIGILFQNIVSTANFWRQKVLDVRAGFRLAFPSIFGSVSGAYIVLSLPERTVELVIAVILVVMLIPLFYKPSKWIKGSENTNERRNQFVEFVLFFLIGVYGGFIQAGVGIFLLSSLVLYSGYDLVRANALKVFINLIFTPFALGVFIWKGQIDFLSGLVLAGGNAIGAFIASSYAVKWGSSFIRYILIAVIILSAIKIWFFP